MQETYSYDVWILFLETKMGHHLTGPSAIHKVPQEICSVINYVPKKIIYLSNNCNMYYPSFKK